MSDVPQRPAASEPSFAEELQRARQGDGEALDRIVRRVLPQLERRSREQVGPWLAGRIGASDLVQNALVAVVSNIGKFEGQTQESFRAWLDRIVHRAALQERRRLRAGQRRPPSDVAELRQLASMVLPVTSPPSADARDAEFAAICETALAELTIEQGLALRAVVFEQRPVAEVAAELGRSADALHALLGRARARLAVRLEQLGAYRRSDH